MSNTGMVQFPQHERLMCAAITLDEPDFHTEYDEAKCVWTASWKWSGDQLPVSLKNRLSEWICRYARCRSTMVFLAPAVAIPAWFEHTHLHLPYKHSHVHSTRDSP